MPLKNTENGSRTLSSVRQNSSVGESSSTTPVKCLDTSVMGNHFSPAAGSCTTIPFFLYAFRTTKWTMSQCRIAGRRNWPRWPSSIRSGPHAAASVCLMSGRNPRPLKFNSPCMRLHPCAQHRIKQPPHQRALLKNDVGLKQHARLKRHLQHIGIDVRSLESHTHAVGRLLEGDRPGSFVA